MAIGELNFNRNLRLVRLSGRMDAGDEHFRDFRKLIESREELYPGIDIWFRRRVTSGIESGERLGLMLYEGRTPIGVAIVKREHDAKLCHMQIASEYRERGFGNLLMSLIAAEVQECGAGRMHFTVPQGTWLTERTFFEGFGFSEAGLARVQYRLGHLSESPELYCSTEFVDLWDAVVRRLPEILQWISSTGNSLDRWDLVLSIKGEFWRRILSGRKRVEIRRKFSARWKHARVLFYASSPHNQLVGEAVIEDIVVDAPRNIWSNFGELAGCSRDEFENYCRGASRVSALLLRDVWPFETPMSKREIETLIKQDLVSPQSHVHVRRSAGWPAALSLSCLLVGTSR